MFSAYNAKNVFSFLKEESMIAGFFTLGKGCIRDPLMLETIFPFHSSFRMEFSGLSPVNDYSMLICFVIIG